MIFSLCALCELWLFPGRRRGVDPRLGGLKFSVTAAGA